MIKLRIQNRFNRHTLNRLIQLTTQMISMTTINRMKWNANWLLYCHPPYSPCRVQTTDAVCCANGNMTHSQTQLCPSSTNPTVAIRCAEDLHPNSQRFKTSRIKWILFWLRTDIFSKTHQRIFKEHLVAKAEWEWIKRICTYIYTTSIHWFTI